QRPIPPFRVPPEPSLPFTPLESGAAEASERARIEQVVQARIQRDYDAVREKVNQDVARFRETEQATAEKEALLEAEAREPEFRQHYQAVAASYADQIAPLKLEAIGLQP